MLSGIASYLFGSTTEDDFPANSDDVTLTTFPMENEWLLVDRAGMFDIPVFWPVTIYVGKPSATDQPAGPLNLLGKCVELSIL